MERKSIFITATQINYFFVCKRKLWLFSHNITMEHNSELVELGSLLHKDSYKKRRKEIEFDGIKIDFFEKNKALIHEVKKSTAIEKSHIWQIKYYLYRLKELGINVEGKIDYPLQKKTESISLSDTDEMVISNIISKLKQILKEPLPPQKIAQKICKKCSYYEFCYA
ncbi:CRISPR-associated RecB family exonuclease Cas4a [Desulfurella amilsii]|uniref:CRISPR-associated exonuclease Cas4 n=1 Tax=Desulfurella amilsii TaxID=1562698 RepID=A0A1X4XVE2_9BACT|nr:CRISPR-associated protein Cas4 [Desulfurella amilsii]OSS41509.1 CRISPR-associated RecB family exonuclease Cas4a [Desulfurella amilsii]